MVVIHDSDVARKTTESEMEYVQRMCSTKEINKLSWKKLAELLNSTLGYSYSESYYRRHFNNGDFVNSMNNSVTVSTTDDCSGQCEGCEMLPVCLSALHDDIVQQEAKAQESILKLNKLRVKLNDERAENRRYVQRLSREETLKEIASDFAKTMSSKKLLPVRGTHSNPKSEKAGILLLSDWHYGMTCNNPWNKFDPEICRQRVSKLLTEVIKIVETQKIDSVTVLNLSDLIAGRIHTQIRIESRFDVITQTMEVAEILAEFLTELSLHCEVHYHDCLDNHSRLEPNKNDSMDLESLVRIIPWYLTERLGTANNITIHKNEFGADIITCSVFGHNIIGVHGDNDKPTTALERLSLMTHRHYDMLCTAHLHHFSADENHESVIVSNSSLMGVDTFSAKLRLRSKPSQTFIVSSPENVCQCIYKINLD